MLLIFWFYRQQQLFFLSSDGEEGKAEEEKRRGPVTLMKRACIGKGGPWPTAKKENSPAWVRSKERFPHSLTSRLDYSRPAPFQTASALPPRAGWGGKKLT